MLTLRPSSVQQWSSTYPIPIRLVLSTTSLYSYSISFLVTQTCGSNSLCVCSRPAPSLELQALSEAAYREHFHEQDHYNYYCEDPDIGPCVLSIKREEEGPHDFRYSTTCKYSAKDGEVAMMRTYPLLYRRCSF